MTERGIKKDCLINDLRNKTERHCIIPLSWLKENGFDSSCHLSDGNIRFLCFKDNLKAEILRLRYFQSIGDSYVFE